MANEQGPFELLDRNGQGEGAASASIAPALPIEAPLVRAVRAFEGLKAQAETALLILEHCPRDEAQIQRSVNIAIEQVNRASEACWHLAQLRSAKGQR